MLEEYRRDDTNLSLACLNSFLTKMDEFSRNVRVHKAVLDLIWEKPTEKHLDRLPGRGIVDEYDQLLDAIRVSGSFEEANTRAEEIWDW